MLAVAAFVALALFAVPFPLVVLWPPVSLGWLLGRVWPIAGRPEADERPTTGQPR